MTCRSRRRPPRKSATTVRAFKVDVSDLAAVEKTRDATLKAFGKIDILVNNAGIAGINKTVWETDLDEWRKVLRINLDGPFICCKAVVPAMLAQKYGRIVNIASIAGKEGNPNAAHYSASKAGVIALTKSLGKELAAARHPGQRRDAGGGEDRDLRPDDAAAHRLHAVENPDGPLRAGARSSPRWWPGWRRRTARSRPARCSTSPAAARRTSPNKNCENNPMQRKEPLANKGVAGMAAPAAKNILTRRANQWHIFIIPLFWQNASRRCAMMLCSRRAPPLQVRLWHIALVGAVQRHVRCSRYTGNDRPRGKPTQLTQNGRAAWAPTCPTFHSLLFSKNSNQNRQN